MNYRENLSMRGVHRRSMKSKAGLNSWASNSCLKMIILTIWASRSLHLALPHDPLSEASSGLAMHLGRLELPKSRCETWVDSRHRERVPCFRKAADSLLWGKASRTNKSAAWMKGPHSMEMNSLIKWKETKKSSSRRLIHRKASRCPSGDSLKLKSMGRTRWSRSSRNWPCNGKWTMFKRRWSI